MEKGLNLSAHQVTMFGAPCNSNLYIGKQFVPCPCDICVVSFFMYASAVEPIRKCNFPNFFPLPLPLFLWNVHGVLILRHKLFASIPIYFLFTFFEMISQHESFSERWSSPSSSSSLLLLLLKNKNNKTPAINLISHNATRIPGARSEINDGENVCVCLWTTQRVYSNRSENSGRERANDSSNVANATSTTSTTTTLIQCGIRTNVCERMHTYLT